MKGRLLNTNGVCVRLGGIPRLRAEVTLKARWLLHAATRDLDTWGNPSATCRGNVEGRGTSCGQSSLVWNPSATCRGNVEAWRWGHTSSWRGCEDRRPGLVVILDTAGGIVEVVATPSARHAGATPTSGAREAAGRPAASSMCPMLRPRCRRWIRWQEATWTVRAILTWIRLLRTWSPERR